MNLIIDLIIGSVAKKYKTSNIAKEAISNEISDSLFDLMSKNNNNNYPV